MERVIDVGQYIVSKNQEEVLKIYGLASCIGLVLHCPKNKITGVAHFLLPTSNLNPDLGNITPAYFVDTGVDILINCICNGYKCDKRSLEVSIYGGAQARVENDVFNIGSRNVQAVIKKLNDHKLNIKDSDTGGRFSRTIKVSVNDGKVNLKVLESSLL